MIYRNEFFPGEDLSIMENKKQTFASDTSGRSVSGWAKALAILLAGPFVQFWLPSTRKPVQAILKADI